MSDHSTASLPRKSAISRRSLLAGGVGAGGALLLAGAGRRSLADADATPPAGHESHMEADGAGGSIATGEVGVH